MRCWSESASTRMADTLLKSFILLIIFTLPALFGRFGDPLYVQWYVTALVRFHTTIHKSVIVENRGLGRQRVGQIYC